MTQMREITRRMRSLYRYKRLGIMVGVGYANPMLSRIGGFGKGFYGFFFEHELDRGLADLRWTFWIFCEHELRDELNELHELGLEVGIYMTTWKEMKPERPLLG
jgi:hypothetical protein